MNEDLQNLKTLMNAMKSDNLTADEFAKAYTEVLKVVKDIKDTSSQEWQALKDAVESIKTDVNTSNSQSLFDLENQVQILLDKHSKVMENKLSSMKDGVDGTNGKDGLPADELKIIDAVLKQIPPTPIAPADAIRDRLESLKGEERLDAFAIKNLPQETKRIVGGMGHPALWSLADVNVVGITTDQSIKWDFVATSASSRVSNNGEPPVTFDVLF